MTVKIHHFVNLTNGIGVLPSLPFDAQFLYIRSTTIERKDWLTLFGDLDHNFLMSLALGRRCVVYDMGTNRPSSKVIYYGIPLIRYALNRLWYGLNPPVVLAGRGKGVDVRVCFEGIYSWLFIQGDALRGVVKKKLNYYRHFLGAAAVDLVGVSWATARDGDRDYHRRVLHTWASCSERTGRV